MSAAQVCILQLKQVILQSIYRIENLSRTFGNMRFEMLFFVITLLHKESQYLNDRS